MKNIQINSKQVTKGDIFVAITCPNVKQYINEAFQNGASIVFSEFSEDSRVIKINDARLLASKLAKFTYDKQPNTCVSVTGTNGKSSVAHFLSQIWQYSGKNTANLGTLGLFINGEKTDLENITIPNLTTPDSITLHKILDHLAKRNITHLVFEASSHALDQKRLHSVELSAAAFTNLASDHLDYHKTKESYLSSKLHLFKEILENDKPAIVSKDYPEIFSEVSKLNKNIISFGLNKGNFVRAENIKEFSDHIIFDISFGKEIFKNLSVKLFGQFQIMNILCASALAFSCGLSPEEIIETFTKLSTLNGRMEHVRSINRGNVYIDYAHTSEAFKNALKCFRKVCKGRLICVFGCGGNRDKSKRKEMGKIADELADIVIITDDNPRFESPESIRSEIILTCPNALNIPNRKDAIYKAISLINSDDFVVVIGKGHEDYQIYGNETKHFSDKETILNFK